MPISNLFIFSRTGNEEITVKPEPTCEERPEWTTIWIKKEEERDFKMEVQEEAVEAEDTAITSTYSHRNNG